MKDIIRLKPIMELLPDGIIDYNHLKIIFSILEYEYGIDTSENLNFSIKKNDNNEGEEISSPKKRKLPFWLNNQKKKKDYCGINNEDFIYNIAKKRKKNLQQIKLDSIFY
jgi:hypothetical protein